MTDRRPFSPFFAEGRSSGDDSDSNWLMSYADMMTLLFSFFVIATMLSVPDPLRMERLKRATAKAVGGSYREPYSRLTESLRHMLVDFSLEKDVTVVPTEEGVALISKGTVFFDRSSTALKPVAQRLLEKLAGVLVSEVRAFRIVVEGHTDDLPMVSKSLPSNWELSASRASTVVRLLEAKGFPHADLQPVGLADTQPLVPNRDVANVAIDANQALNRRIVIRIQRKLAARGGGREVDFSEILKH